MLAPSSISMLEKPPQPEGWASPAPGNPRANREHQQTLVGLQDWQRWFNLPALGQKSNWLEEKPEGNLNSLLHQKENTLYEPGLESKAKWPTTIPFQTGISDYLPSARRSPPLGLSTFSFKDKDFNEIMHSALYFLIQIEVVLLAFTFSCNQLQSTFHRCKQLWKYLTT